MTIQECSTAGCEAFALYGETKCHSCLVDEHRAKQAAPRAPLTVGEAIDLLSLAARSSTWQGADPRLAKALLEVLRSETEACFRAQINCDHMRNERDEASAALLKERAEWEECTRQTAAQACHRPEEEAMTPSAKHVEQPAPTGNGAEVFRVAIAECPSVSLAEALKAREAIGIERYGTTLRTHNGRDVVRDLREELADAYVYATQAGMEAGEPPPDHLLRSVRWALVEAWRALEEHERRRRLEVP